MSAKLKNFVNELKKNSNLKKLMPLGDQVWDDFIGDADCLTGPLAEELTLQDEDYTWFQTEGGKIKFPGGKGITMSTIDPTSLQTVVYNGQVEIWVGSYADEIKRFSTGFDYLGQVGYAADFNNGLGNTYYYLSEFFADPANDRLYVCSRIRHMVRVFELSTMQVVYDIGTYGVSGNPQDSLLSSPRSLRIMPTGELAIACAGGGPVGSDADVGHVSLFNADTGVYISSPLMYKGRGYCTTNECFSPYRIKIDTANDQAWLLNYSRNEIGVFDISNPTVWNCVDVYTITTDAIKMSEGDLAADAFNVNGQGLQGFDFDDDYLFVCASGTDWIFRIKRTDHSIAGTIKSNILSEGSNPFRIKAFINLRDIMAINGILLATETTLDVVYAIPSALFDDLMIDMNYKELQYTIPSDPNSGFYVPRDVNAQGKIKVPYIEIFKQNIPAKIYRIYTK